LPEKFAACEVDGDHLLENIDRLLARHTEGIEAIQETAADFEQTQKTALNFRSKQHSLERKEIVK